MSDVEGLSGTESCVDMFRTTFAIAQIAIVQAANLGHCDERPEIEIGGTFLETSSPSKVSRRISLSIRKVALLSVVARTPAIRLVSKSWVRLYSATIFTASFPEPVNCLSSENVAFRIYRTLSNAMDIAHWRVTAVGLRLRNGCGVWRTTRSSHSD